MKTKLRQMGELLIENRHAPPPDQRYIERVGKATGKLIIAPPMPVYETRTFTCSHCHGIVIYRPQRNPHWCWGCDHYICSKCEVVRKIKGCMPLNKVLDQMQTEAFRQLGRG